MKKPTTPDQVQRNQRRKFRWLELVAQCPAFRKKAVAMRLAVYIMKNYHTFHGYIEFSKNAAALWLELDPSQVTRARNLFVKLGWLRLVRTARAQRFGYSANRYDLAGGPDDLILDDFASDAEDDG
jgi:hypothetical protein